MDEKSPNGTDYLSEICREWEGAAMEAEPGTRVVILRTGIVLAKEGGALSRMIPVFKIFAGKLSIRYLKLNYRYDCLRRPFGHWETMDIMDTSR